MSIIQSLLSESEGGDVNTSHDKICILPQQLGLGGPASFQAGLIKAFKARGISISHEPLDPSLSAILVFGGTRNIGELKRAQKTGVRVVQRLNGMNWIQRRKYTGVRHFLKAEYGNLKLRTIRRMADRVIYQSEFACGWWEREHGVLKKPQAVIYNGVDLDLFTPFPPTPPSDHTRVLMVEAHHGSGYEQGLISAIRLVQLLAQRMDRACELMVVGDVPVELRKQVEKPGLFLTWQGVVRHEAIPAIDRSAHLFFSGDLNATCPNAAIEAMACGLPVVSYDTGAMSELVPEEVGRIAPYGGNVWKLEEPNGVALADATQQVLAERGRFSEGARNHAESNFNIQNIADRYLEVLLGS